MQRAISASTDYINYIKAKASLASAIKSEKPILSDEDEQFLTRITSEGEPPPLPPRHILQDDKNDGKMVIFEGHQIESLPPLPQEGTTEHPFTDEPEETKQISSAASSTWKRPTWSWLRRDSRDTKREATAAGLDDIAKELKEREAGSAEDAELRREEEEMGIVLDRLNLAAINNRVFSISDETQELLEKFNQVFKDLVNGVPTAYKDLESLLTNGDQQLQKTYDSLPPFLQKLIQKLPDTMTKNIGPGVMAAAAEKSSKGGINMANAGKAAAAAAQMLKTPSLKDIVSKPAAITNALKSIVGYLRARFPAFMGLNVLWSMAMFVLLIVFWYCHKRGREVRLDKERDLTEQEVQRLDVEYRAAHPNERYTTTAPIGASDEEVQAGILEAQTAREAAAAAGGSEPPSKAEASGTTPTPDSTKRAS